MFGFDDVMWLAFGMAILDDEEADEVDIGIRRKDDGADEPGHSLDIDDGSKRGVEQRHPRR